MSKDSASVKLDIPKDFWKQAVTDASRKISEAKLRIKELERAREVFRRNAANNVPIPGSSEEHVTAQ